MNIVPFLLKVPENTNGRDFIIGDIHGDLDKLRNLMGRIKFDEKTDRLICVGDLIDRGGRSWELLEMTQESWFYSVLGNHEYLMYSAILDNNSVDRVTWLTNGGGWIADTDPKKWDKWCSIIKELPLGIELKSGSTRYGIVHADYPKEKWTDFEKMNREECFSSIWSRKPFHSRDEKVISDIDVVVHGHNVIPKGHENGLRLGNRIYIESGAYKGEDFILLEV
jgi:serine/threonine protein phosphatase 1